MCDSTRGFWWHFFACSICTFHVSYHAHNTPFFQCIASCHLTICTVFQLTQKTSFLIKYVCKRLSIRRSSKKFNVDVKRKLSGKIMVKLFSSRDQETKEFCIRLLRSANLILNNRTMYRIKIYVTHSCCSHQSRVDGLLYNGRESVILILQFIS